MEVRKTDTTPPAREPTAAKKDREEKAEVATSGKKETKQSGVSFYDVLQDTLNGQDEKEKSSSKKKKEKTYDIHTVFNRYEHGRDKRTTSH